ncbi:putative membrane protein [Nocardiopsis mwathae]|uniref:Putative membrane protein n=1 Tax=Nocardiopsis mwathae TaxID=1472723 RepID=A0A7X0D6A1_9ACTN|nr:hypothetical protein [Nocardiopsis mwathae]MBB6171889.1 putative membrane protein [Nocardiopsis mwathae]
MNAWCEVMGMSWGHGLMQASTWVFWSLVIVGFVLLVRYAVRESRGDAARTWRKAAEQTLGERFARGEIDTYEYRERLSELRSAMGRDSP